MNGPRRRQPSGQTLPLFAIVLPGILAVMALGLDGAQLFLERRQAQGAADLAALAGAKSLPADQVQATADALAVAAANGYASGGVTVTLPAPNEIKVDIDSGVSTFFMGIFGISEMPVGAYAVALHEEEVVGAAGAAGPTVLGTDEICDGDKQVVFMSGADIVVGGNVISNSGTQWSGGNGTVTGDYTFVEDPKLVPNPACVGTLVNEADIGEPQTVFP